MNNNVSQLCKLRKYFENHELARAYELFEAGIDRKTIQRGFQKGEIMKISRGLYQSLGAPSDINIGFAEISKRVPLAVICGQSALNFHELTDQVPRKISYSIPRGAWRPKISDPPCEIYTSVEPYYSGGIEVHHICGLQVRVYSLAKSICDAFRNYGMVSRSIAIEALKTAIRFEKITPGELSEVAEVYKVEKTIRPYLEVLISNG